MAWAGRESTVEVPYKGVQVRKLEPAVRIRRILARCPAIQKFHADAQQGCGSIRAQ